MTVLLTVARHRGQEVHIAGEDFSPQERAKAARLRKQLVSVARRHGVGIAFIADALGTELLEMMDITTAVTKEAPMMVIDTLARRLDTPIKDEKADLHLAWEAFENDCRRVQRLTMQKLDFELAAACWINQYGWLEYWAANHWDLQKRSEFWKALRQIEPIRARLAASAQRAKQGRTAEEGATYADL